MNSNDVPSELKEQLFTAASRVIHDPDFLDSVIPDVEVVDAILAAIAKAGYVVVKADRWERVQIAASHWQWEWQSRQDSRQLLFEPMRFRQPLCLQPGDLDPLTPEGRG